MIADRTEAYELRLIAYARQACARMLEAAFAPWNADADGFEILSDGTLLVHLRGVLHTINTTVRVS